MTDPLTHAEQEMLDHSVEVLEQAVELQRLLLAALETGEPCWGWGRAFVDPADVFEAARAVRAFPPLGTEGAAGFDTDGKTPPSTRSYSPR